MKKTMKIGFIRELKQTRGRFISIMLLMFLSTFTLVGLKLVGPDIRVMANQYLDEYQLADVTIIGSYGINADDQALIEKQGDNVTVEYGYLTDTTIGDSNSSIRLFSQSDQVSQVEVVDGRMPETANEIAISNQMKEDYPNGSTINVTEKGASKNNVLKNHEFTIVGHVNSLEILSTMELGSTNVGTGSLNGYGVIATENFDSEVYSIARLYYKSLRGKDAFLDDYLETVSREKDTVEVLFKDQPQARLSKIQADANKKLDSNEKKIKEQEDELNAAQSQLADSKTQLDSAYAALLAAKQKLIDGQSKIDDGKSQLTTAKSQLADGYAQIAEKQAELDAKQAELDASLAKLNKEQAKLEKAFSDLNSRVQKLATNVYNQNSDLTQEEIEAMFPDVNFEEGASSEEEIEQIQSNINGIYSELMNSDFTTADIEKFNNQLTELQKELDITDEQYQEFMKNIYTPEMDQIILAQEEILKAYAELVEAQEQLDAYRYKLENGQAAINDGQTKLNSAKSKLDSQSAQVAASEQTLNQSQSLLNQKWSEYYSGESNYQNGLAQYQSGLEQFNSKEPDARSKIAEAYKKLAAAKKEVAELSLPVYTISTRSETASSGGYQVLSSLATSIDKIANIFPFLLYAVAALVTYTTMTRYVEDERINTGTLLSLGYSEREIIRKYVIYGALSSSAGAILGIILGAISIPTLLYTAFRSQFSTPDLVLTFDFSVAVLALIVAILCAVIPAFMVASAEFKISPAGLLLPKPPSAGSKILLERVTPIWNRMKFSHKVTARNIFRYKKRMFMTIFGVSGSVALLFTGLGMQGSIGNASALQFGEIIDYDMITVVDSKVEKNDAAAIKQFLDQDTVTDYMPVYIENVSVESGENNERQAITLNVADNFNDYITFRDRLTHEKIELTDAEVIITERLAQIEDLKVGDSFTVQSAKNLPIELKVGGITEMYMGHFIYANPQTYKQAFNEEANLSSYLVKLKDNSASNVKSIATEVLQLDGVKTVMQNNSLIAQIDNIAVSLNAVMKMIIGISGMLAIVILYNITNINVNERMRELSTTKVLGYFDNEVTMYIYRETMILSLIGIGVGYVLGHYIHKYMIHTVASLNMMFDERVVKEAFIAPAILIIIVSITLGILVHQRLKKVDMLEALKSVE